MTNFRLIAAAACLLIAVVVPWGQSPAKASPLNETGCGGVIVSETNADFEQQIIELTNRERARVKLPPLKRVSALDDSARYFAADMAADDYWPNPGNGSVSHGTYDRTRTGLVYVCPWDQRIGSFYPNPTGENLAAGYSKPADVIKGWLNSAGHRANLLSSKSWEIGAGFAQGGTWGFYWVEDFGKQPGDYPLIINAEAAATDSRDVSLYVYGDWSEIRIKNDNGAWGDWQPFAHTIAWQLPSGGGPHFVFAEMRSSDGGTSALSSDSIYLNAPILPPSLGVSLFSISSMIR